MNIKRIQRKRTKGWRMPQNTISVGRPGRFGNPFVIIKLEERNLFGVRFENLGLVKFTGTKIECQKQAVIEFKNFWKGDRKFNKEIKKELKGKNLACWCKEGEPCHGDYLFKIANQ